MMMGWTPKVADAVPLEPEVETTATVQLGVGDGGGHV
jgi:hypothetical protein